MFSLAINGQLTETKTLKHLCINYLYNVFFLTDKIPKILV